MFRWSTSTWSHRTSWCATAKSREGPPLHCHPIFVCYNPVEQLTWKVQISIKAEIMFHCIVSSSHCTGTTSEWSWSTLVLPRSSTQTTGFALDLPARWGEPLSLIIRKFYEFWTFLNTGEQWELFQFPNKQKHSFRLASWHLRWPTPNTSKTTQVLLQTSSVWG